MFSRSHPTEDDDSRGLGRPQKRAKTGSRVSPSPEEHASIQQNDVPNEPIHSQLKSNDTSSRFHDSRSPPPHPPYNDPQKRSIYSSSHQKNSIPIQGKNFRSPRNHDQHQEPLQMQPKKIPVQKVRTSSVAQKIAALELRSSAPPSPSGSNISSKYSHASSEGFRQYRNSHYRKS